MGLAPCRDCGEMLPDAAAGCPRCARNILAERRVARVLAWVAVVVAVAAIAAVARALR
jgi:hypothetical protein